MPFDNPGPRQLDDLDRAAIHALQLVRSRIWPRGAWQKGHIGFGQRRHCVIGWIAECTRHAPNFVASRAVHLLCDVLPPPRDEYIGQFLESRVIDFNDDQRTRQKDVVKLLDTAIAKALL